MPNLPSILALYRALSTVALSGALAEERKAATEGELARVARQFLTGDEQVDWSTLSPAGRAARLRKGCQRFYQWEAANPDLVAVLKRRARRDGIA